MKIQDVLIWYGFSLGITVVFLFRLPDWKPPIWQVTAVGLTLSLACAVMGCLAVSQVKRALVNAEAFGRAMSQEQCDEVMTYLARYVGGPNHMVHNKTFLQAGAYVVSVGRKAYTSRDDYLTDRI